MKMKNVIDSIEKVQSKPLTQQPTFYPSELDQIVKKYAPNYPQSMNSNEFYSVCNAMLCLGYIKGCNHQKNRSRLTASKK